MHNAQVIHTCVQTLHNHTHRCTGNTYLSSDPTQSHTHTHTHTHTGNTCRDCITAKKSILLIVGTHTGISRYRNVCVIRRAGWGGVMEVCVSASRLDGWVLKATLTAVWYLRQVVASQPSEAPVLMCWCTTGIEYGALIDSRDYNVVIMYEHSQTVIEAACVTRSRAVASCDTLIQPVSVSEPSTSGSNYCCSNTVSSPITLGISILRPSILLSA